MAEWNKQEVPGELTDENNLYNFGFLEKTYKISPTGRSRQPRASRAVPANDRRRNL